ncbi:MAG: polysaccharide pyruvyl transferase family protein [Lutibacter sp.]
MKISVGIITIHDIYNYGSILQAYATQKVIEDLGYNAEIINYKYPNAYHCQNQSLKGRVFSKLNGFLKDLLPGKKYETYKRNYSDFTNKHYKLSKEIFPTVDSIIKNPPHYNILLSGSDQIWRAEVMKGDPVFFLDFSKNKKKVAYASSFGSVSIPTEYHAKYRKYLNNFSAIGVREKTGVKMVKELTNINAELVLDPTLLLTKLEWMQVMEIQAKTEPYILCYGITSKDNYMERLALHIKKHTGYKIIRINGKFFDYFNKSMQYILDAGPAQWLGLFANASLILGQSFHATAFAVNFERPFIPILRGDDNHDSRQLQFLKLIGLENRAITVGDKFPEVDKSLLEVDFKAPIEVLDKERKNSIIFLINALQIDKKE